MTTVREAACACGGLRITCEGEPALVSMCHCLDCQRRTGSTFGVQAWFRRDRMQPSSGNARHFTRTAASGLSVTFTFCPSCGTTLFWEAEKVPDLLAVAVGTFAEPGFPPPVQSSWERRQHPWTICLNASIERHVV